MTSVSLMASVAGQLALHPGTPAQSSLALNTLISDVPLRYISVPLFVVSSESFTFVISSIV